MAFHGSIGRAALGGIASAVLALGMGAAAAQAQEPIKIGVTLTQSPPGSVIQGTEVCGGSRSRATCSTSRAACWIDRSS
jgi:hypothetical protein